jgi:WD40 repeat protein/serine/threonine protein kinase
MAEPIRKLGPYTLVSRIGLGGFGVVWLAEKRTAIATTQFALKLPRGEDIDLEAFKQEAAIWIQASGHPNVLPLIDADIYDEQVVIVSEYVPDGSLAGWLKQHGGKAPTGEAALEIMDGILAGLSHLHARRIIHRDLKPENILMQRETPRLADFGIARLLKSSSHSAKVSGTLAYMAPEAFDGNRNEQTDVWSVGVIFYEMLSGHLPYDQPNIPSFIGAIMRHDPPPLPGSVPEVLRQIVTKALQRDPANRYASAADMRRDLREAEHRVWLGGRKTVVEPETPAPRPIRPQPIALQPTVPLPPAKTEPSILPAKPTLPSETLPLPMPDEKKSRSLLWLAGGGAVVVALLVGTFTLTGIYYWKSSRAASKTQSSSPSVAKQSQGPYALKQTLLGHTYWVRSVAFSPDAKVLASGSADETMKLWDVKTGASKRTLLSHGGSVYSVAFSPDGMVLASGIGETVKLWDTQTGALMQTLIGHNGPVWSVAFSRDGMTLASASDDYTVKLWDAQTGTLKQTLTAHANSVKSVAFSPDGKTLASGADDNTVKLWNAQTGVLRQTLYEHSDSVLSVAFSPDGKTLASGSKDKTIKLWDVQTGALKETLTGHSSYVWSITFSSDGSMLASGGADHMVKVWNAQTGALKQTLSGHSDFVTTVAFSPDGKTLASASDDKTVNLWRGE